MKYRYYPKTKRGILPEKSDMEELPGLVSQEEIGGWKLSSETVLANLHKNH